MRRSTGWQFGPGSSVKLSFTSGGIFLIPDPVLVVEDGITLVRTRGMVDIFLTNIDFTGGGFHGAVGLAIVDTQAAGVGVSALPGPLSRPDWDGWFWHHYFDVHVGDLLGGGGTNQAPGNVKIEIDSKAMRKLTINDAIVGIMESAEAIVGGAFADLYLDCRMLVKFP